MTNIKTIIILSILMKSTKMLDRSVGDIIGLLTKLVKQYLVLRLNDTEALNQDNSIKTMLTNYLGT